jgi:hypothetical protein
VALIDLVLFYRESVMLQRFVLALPALPTAGIANCRTLFVEPRTFTGSGSRL